MDERREYHFTENEFRQWLFGADSQIHMEIFLQGEQNDFSKDYLIKRLTEAYHERMSQQIRRFQTAE